VGWHVWSLRSLLATLESAEETGRQGRWL